MKKNLFKFTVMAALTAVIVCACQSGQVPSTATSNNSNKKADATSSNADKLLIVDCLLPGQIIQLGDKLGYQTEPEPIKTSAVDCEIRGGEYVAFDRADYRTALKVWLPKAKEGDAAAQNYVGEIHEKGLGVQPNFQHAVAWYKKAAEQDYAPAQINLGYMYEKGLGISKDMTEALNWYRKSSGLNNTDLVLTTSIEVANASIQEAQVQELYEEVNRYKQEIQNLRQHLIVTKSELERKKLQREVEQKESNAIKIQQQITKLQTDDNQKESQDQHTSAGPSIEITNPPLALIRGIPTVKLLKHVNEKNIVGKVRAPSGLSRLSINGVVNTPDKFGTFRASVPIHNDKTVVKVVAIDNNGRETSFDFIFVADETLKSNISNSGNEIKSPFSAKYGNYHALIIGNHSYTNFSDLASAENDAKYIDSLLSQKYGFKTNLLIDATRAVILNTLNELRNTLSSDDNLLVYYAGHGELVPSGTSGDIQGYWLPVDADVDKNTKWISNRAITDILDNMATRHVLVIADSCYSGTMTRTSMPKLNKEVSSEVRNKWVNAMLKHRSRKVFSSGGIKPVLDSAGGKHSIFAQVLFQVLEQNNEILVLGDVYFDIANRVQALAADYNIQQKPQYGPIRFGGHGGGEFFFVPKNLQRAGYNSNSIAYLE